MNRVLGRLLGSALTLCQSLTLKAESTERIRRPMHCIEPLAEQIR